MIDTGSRQGRDCQRLSPKILLGAYLTDGAHLYRVTEQLPGLGGRDGESVLELEDCRSLDRIFVADLGLTELRLIKAAEQADAVHS